MDKEKRDTQAWLDELINVMKKKPDSFDFFILISTDDGQEIIGTGFSNIEPEKLILMLEQEIKTIKEKENVQRFNQ